MPSRSPKKALLAALLFPTLLGLPACGSAAYQRVVSVNPSDASLYINGEYVGKGDRRPRDFDFSSVQRVYVQAVHPDYQPVTEWFTETDMKRMVNTNTDLKITLRPR